MRPAVALLDFKLGLRMLVKYPGLTLVGGLAFAFAIGLGAGSFEGLTQLSSPALPLADGARVVGVRNWDAAENRAEAPGVHDFAAWRRELRSVRELGAFQTMERNLIVGSDNAGPVEVAEISASAFRVARVAPLLGRALVEADERPGAPAVVVIGHDVWTSRFGGDPGVVGRTVRLGGTPSTVVGVMPEGFAFPVAHSLWVPLRLSADDFARGEGPGLRVFGRLAPGATLETAQAELATLGRRAAADFPDTHRHLRPQVMAYALSFLDLPGFHPAALMSVNLFLVMLLVLVCGNVALLMFARAATREGEIVVRFALGATRGRIIGQLFAEALVLGALGACVGLAAAHQALRWVLDISAVESGGRLPFWFHAGLSPATLLYTGALTVVGAAVAGVLPALMATSRGVEARLRQVSAGGGGMRVGGVWTGVLVAQVAVTVAFPAAAFSAREYVAGVRSLDVGFPAREYLSARLEMDRESDAGAPADTSTARFLARYRATAGELERRLAAEPGVAAVTFTDRLPHTFHPPRRVEVEGGGAAPAAAAGSDEEHLVSSASVDVDYFDVLGAPILSGRGFHSGDAGSGGGGVIVNRSFVAQELGGRNPVGRRVRYLDPEGEPGPWYEIVGVVKDLGMIADDPAKGAGLYHAAAPGAVYPMHLVLHARGNPESIVPGLRAVATSVDPGLRLHEVLPLDEVGSTLWLELAFLFRLLLVVSSLALLLSLAGIYSVMSYTVSRRTREIGIRVALGARPRRIALTIISRPLTQVGIGIVAGGALTAAMTLVASGGHASARGAALLVAHMTLMVGVCMLACVVPTRRALRIEPTEALKGDG